VISLFSFACSENEGAKIRLPNSDIISYALKIGVTCVFVFTLYFGS